MGTKIQRETADSETAELVALYCEIAADEIECWHVAEVVCGRGNDERCSFCLRQLPVHFVKVISNNHRLWEIEDAFRLCKHDLKIRPIFHWKSDRIKAHLAICFIAYALARQLTYRYRLRQGKSASYAVLRKELARTRFSLLRHTRSGELYGMPVKPRRWLQLSID